MRGCQDACGWLRRGLRLRRFRKERLTDRPIHIHVPYARLDGELDALRADRHDLEIFFSAEMLDQLQPSALSASIEQLDWNPRISLHAPFMDLNPGAIDPLIRTATLTRFDQLIEVARIIRPVVAVFHAAYDKWRYAGKTDLWLARSLPVWERIADAASACGTRIALENVFDEDPEALGMLLKQMDRPNLGFCFDIGHFNLFSRVPMERWFDVLGQRIFEVHLHDNNGTSDAHRSVGSGNIDFTRFFRLLSACPDQPVLTIEAHRKDDIGPGIAAIRKLLS